MSTRKVIFGRSSEYLKGALYEKVFQNGSAPMAVRDEVINFLKSKKRAFKWEVGLTVRRLRERKCYRPALMLAEKMERRGMIPTPGDRAIHLDLIAKARNISAAEQYFISLPEPTKSHQVYGALLNCYCKELMTEKAEGLMEKMKELEFVQSSIAYNSLMTLYSKTDKHERIPSIIQEMQANDVTPDCFTFNIWMRALAAMNDITGVERVMDEMKNDDRVSPDWTTYWNLATIYVQAGMYEKAEEALKELEKTMGNNLKAYHYLITLYGRTGNLNEVHRIWCAHKLAYPKMPSISYENMIRVLVDLKDLSGAEICFIEWESKYTDSHYDIRVANAMLAGYCKEGMFDKMEALKKRAKIKGGRLNSRTWEILMEYYLSTGDMKVAAHCVDRGIKKGRTHGRPWAPPDQAVQDMMSYFEETKDVRWAEKLIEEVKTVKQLGAEVFEALLRTYKAAGKRIPGLRQRLKMEKVVVSEECKSLVDELHQD